MLARTPGGDSLIRYFSICDWNERSAKEAPLYNIMASIAPGDVWTKYEDKIWGKDNQGPWEYGLLSEWIEMWLVNLKPAFLRDSGRGKIPDSSELVGYMMYEKGRCIVIPHQLITITLLKPAGNYDSLEKFEPLERPINPIDYIGFKVHNL